ncbi:MAG: hypothetical protein ACLTSX_02730 [Collinsella sp.]
MPDQWTAQIFARILAHHPRHPRRSDLCDHDMIRASIRRPQAPSTKGRTAGPRAQGRTRASPSSLMGLGVVVTLTTRPANKIAATERPARHTTATIASDETTTERNPMINHLFAEFA